MPTISTAAALYLGADAVAPKDKKFSMGLAVPGKDASVDLKTFSGVLAAAAVHALRESGAVSVQVEQKKGLFGSKSRVAVRAGSGGQPGGDVEAGLLRSLDAKDPYAKGLVWRWLARESSNPWGTVVGAVESELVAAGILEPVEPQGLKGKLGAMGSGRAKTNPVPDAVAAAQPEAVAAVQRWQAFLATEPELAQALVKEARAGIDARLESD